MRRHRRPGNAGLYQPGDLLVGIRAPNLLEQLDAGDARAVVVVTPAAVRVVQRLPLLDLLRRVTVLRVRSAGGRGHHDHGAAE
jgi:hypothetical protein